MMESISSFTRQDCQLWRWDGLSKVQWLQADCLVPKWFSNVIFHYDKSLEGNSWSDKKKSNFNNAEINNKKYSPFPLALSL